MHCSAETRRTDPPDQQAVSKKIFYIPMINTEVMNMNSNFGRTYINSWISVEKTCRNIFARMNSFFGR